MVEAMRKGRRGVLDRKRRWQASASSTLPNGSTKEIAIGADLRGVDSVELVRLGLFRSAASLVRKVTRSGRARARPINTLATKRCAKFSPC